jgi:hypothetical protein
MTLSTLLVAALALGAINPKPQPRAQFSFRATGTTSWRNMDDRLAERVSVRDFGAKCDGTTNDGPALASMLTLLGSQVRTVVVPGVCVTNQALAFPATLQVEFTNGGRFSGTGAATFAGPGIHLTDTQGSAAHLLELDHWADVGPSGYAIDVQNYADNAAAPTPLTGARNAITIHQYSDASGQAAFQIDNTRAQPFIVLKNTRNETHSTGQHGVADYLNVWGYSATAVYPANDPVFLGRLDHLLNWTAADVSRPWTFKSTIAAPALKVAQTAVATGLEVSQAADSIGLYLHKDAVGAGDALLITNKGTGPTLRASNGTANVYSLDGLGMPQIGIGNVTAAPACDATTRMKLWTIAGGAGVKDSVQVCAKDAGDAYAWRTLY